MLATSLRPNTLVLVILTGSSLLASAQQLGPSGTDFRGVVAGTTIEVETGQPVAQARIELYSEGRPNLSVTSDLHGRFVISKVPAGRWFMRAGGTGYVRSHFGALSPNDPGESLTLTSGQKLSGVVVRLWKYAVISGRVVDTKGEPVVGARVIAARHTVNGGRVRLEQERFGHTDDRGIYRLINLQPTATYSLVLQGFSTNAASPELGVQYPMTFYPAGTSSAGAASLTLRSGEERTDMDFGLTPTRVFTVSGTVTGDRVSQTRLLVTLRPDDSAGLPNNSNVRATTADAQGRFSYVGVPSGRYSLTAIDKITDRPASGGYMMMAEPNGRSSVQDLVERRERRHRAVRALTGGEEFFPFVPPEIRMVVGDASLSVDDRNVDDVTVILQPAASLSGRLVFDGVAPKPSNAQLGLTPVLPVSAGPPLGRIGVSGVGTGGQFRTEPLRPGLYFLVVLALFDGWSLESVTADGRSAITEPIELGRSDITDVELRYTDRPAALRGIVTDKRGLPLAGATTVYVFPTDRRAWAAPQIWSVNMREVRVGRDGGYSTAVPPGEYFVAALNGARENWRMPEVLESLATDAARVKVGRSEIVSKNLSVAK